MQLVKMYRMYTDVKQCSVLLNKKIMLKAKYITFFRLGICVHMYI